MRVESSKVPTNPLPGKKEAEGHAPAEEQAASQPHDGLALSKGAHGAHPDGHDPDLMNYVAHKAHNPHGALHAIEVGEHAVHKGVSLAARVGRAASQGGRAASTAAEAAEVAQHASHHHGLIGKAEHLLTRGLSRVGGWFGRAIAAVPGGTKVANGVKAAVRWPGRALGHGVDGMLAGTRVANTVRATGSGARLVANMGGRIPILGSVLGGVIGVVDVKSSIDIMKDPKATTKEKAIAGTQGLLSGASGALGVGALGVAAAAAIGFTAPVSVPVLLGAAAITGLGAFALSFFKKH